MEWVETTGRTIEDAKEAALDELGVDEADAEFEILSEPKLGLFGRLRNEGRVRARVRPTAPRAKSDRRDRRRRNKTSNAAAEPQSTAEADRTAEADGITEADRTGEADSPTSSSTAERAGRPRSNAQPARLDSDPVGQGTNGEQTSAMDVTLEEQGSVASEFLRGLTDRFGLTAEVVAQQNGEDSVDISVTGQGLGILIGPKGSTLLAVQDLTRTVVQRKTGASNGRIFVDVAQYRHKRAEALARFATQIGEAVKRSGVSTALEPMSAADRRVVHDAVAKIAGLSTVSEGEDPHRRVVIVPVEDQGE